MLLSKYQLTMWKIKVMKKMMNSNLNASRITIKLKAVETL